MEAAKKILMLFFWGTMVFSCEKENLRPKYLTENIIVVVIDGARFSETWGDSTHQYIPRLYKEISKSGIINTEFYNNGPTYTLSGHTSITTGNYQEIDNTGKELPKYPSVFQYWNEKKPDGNSKSWIIASKDKLEVLSNCSQFSYHDKFNASTDCGVDGLGSGYREDSITYNNFIKLLNNSRPNLVLVNFREPDYSGHSGNWEDYIEGIRTTDEYLYKIWNYIQESDFYKGKTSLFVTNDHGRHLDDVSNGFISHGDDCLGCRHINFFAYGPDFKENVVLNKKRELIDISATISEIMDFEMEFGQGEVMYELFK
ncbi:alkaline phosphatase family protein [Allomuricauda sp.]|uniref:alkaline phosphatase family protein n=1 Tax=Flagellimonas sp. TaxID=2058762 RepID=UPI001B25F75E|nr:alkaline phosphatase family protein [Allomuricauda sp.]MBO6534136.1 alkaline phosphatase family protein [Allomuricauda sp.]MBO6588042.1 alkaline phosphatase family protein [Allomuricauda sp.]MBO6617667.1 alkaline phosphatase family protein [Allomuricauda sp.]MBO6643322.1 alkaline phosphatase family protein [Allomuricauda sp.]MBO6746002.1 alkaline phosphatase family protein [Allomuricauda sp.]